MNVLVLGGTGYVGGRLIPRLLAEGHSIKVLSRSKSSVIGRTWRHDVDVHVGDLLKPSTLEGLCDGVDCVYYLVHALGSGASFAEIDRRAANNFVRACPPSLKVIYLGGLQSEKALSKHLASRGEVGEILRANLPTTEFRAGVIIGSGSASFEMIRYLTERLPIMVTPKWIDNEIHPIGIRDVLRYLMQALAKAPLGVVEIGSDSQTFRTLMQNYAKERGLKRVILKTPFLAPRLAGLWVGLVTPLSNRVGVPLIEGIVSPISADTKVARKEFPDVVPAPYEHTLRLALRRSEENIVETRWSDSVGRRDGEIESLELADEQGYVQMSSVSECSASQRHLFATIKTIGGKTGYFGYGWAWWLRGCIDKMFGGPGLMRGRRHPFDLFEGESVDFWRVERLREDEMLLLRAEMKTPGKAFLKFEVEPRGESESRLRLTALFEPKGLFGYLYWHSLKPMHRLVFAGMGKAICKEAERLLEIPTAVYPVDIDMNESTD